MFDQPYLPHIEVLFVAGLRLSPASVCINISYSAFKISIFFPFSYITPLFEFSSYFLQISAGETYSIVVRIIQVEEIIKPNFGVEMSDPSLSLDLSLKSARTCGCLATH